MGLHTKQCSVLFKKNDYTFPFKENVPKYDFLAPILGILQILFRASFSMYHYNMHLDQGKGYQYMDEHSRMVSYMTTHG